MDERDALKVAIIGGGNIAQRHLPVLKDLPEAYIAAHHTVEGPMSDKRGPDSGKVTCSYARLLQGADPEARVRPGAYALPSAPGLGVAPNLEALEPYIVNFNANVKG